MVMSMAVTMVALGGVMIVVTIVSAGFGVGIVLGLLFMAAGSLRVWMLRRRAK
jgi:hypothetical protein